MKNTINTIFAILVVIALAIITISLWKLKGSINHSNITLPIGQVNPNDPNLMFLGERIQRKIVSTTEPVNKSRANELAAIILDGARPGVDNLTQLRRNCACSDGRTKCPWGVNLQINLPTADDIEIDTSIFQKKESKNKLESSRKTITIYPLPGINLPVTSTRLKYIENDTVIGSVDLHVYNHDDRTEISIDILDY